MFNEITKEIDWAEAKLVLQTGKIARHADGAVLVSWGQTQVLCTVSSSKTLKADCDFFPLSVNYREMSFAAGKIPGGFNKREGRPSDKEILTSRIIDRAIRPLFDEHFLNETQIVCTVLSYDPERSCDVVAMVGACAAVAISGLPLTDLLGFAKIGFAGGKFILNPSNKELESSQLDLVVAATSSSLMMVEAQSNELSYEQLLKAIEFGQKQISPVIEMISDFSKSVAKPLAKITVPNFDTAPLDQIAQQYQEQIRVALKSLTKNERGISLDAVFSQLSAQVCEKHGDKYTEHLIHSAFSRVQTALLRRQILEDRQRVDGRKLDEIRPIHSQVGLLHKTHGSALFTRGQTQSLAVTTLGGSYDEQTVETLDKEIKEHFTLQYIFPPYCVNEAKPFKPGGRREIGHGKLAQKAIIPVLPSKEEFAYTIRNVAEVTESDGSSSMATVCSTILSLMDAGVPIKEKVAGIAMGLIKKDEQFCILSDIMEVEDYLGDMDFKVAGTKNGITALQMDIKINGITADIVKTALLQAKKGVDYILSQMEKTLSKPRGNLNANAPLIKQIKISKDKIKEVIGPQGKIIKEICEQTSVKIDIAEDGTVKIFGNDAKQVQIAIDKIISLGSEPEIGRIYPAEVIKIIDIGVIIKFFGTKESLIHISDIFISKGQDLNSHFKIGDSLEVKFTGYDSKKRHRVTLRINGTKASEPEEEEMAVVSERKYFN
jgi:polyribonucleotide nucleotidyltransferase